MVKAVDDFPSMRDTTNTAPMRQPGRGHEAPEIVEPNLTHPDSLDLRGNGGQSVHVLRLGGSGSPRMGREVVHEPKAARRCVPDTLINPPHDGSVPKSVVYVGFATVH